MARARNKLTARQAAAITKPGRHSDGGSLYLAIDGEGEAIRRRWLFLFQWKGKRREMGLGGFPTVSLADARKARDEAERMVREGQDPIAARRAADAQKGGLRTFGDVAEALLKDKVAEFRNEKHRAQWAMTLKNYAKKLWNMEPADIEVSDVLGVLKPLWSEKPETASRLRGRIEAVLSAAKVHGLRSGENPAAWRDNLDHILPKRAKLTRGHHAAMAYSDVPTFLASLREREAVAAMALEFCILTATRSGEVLGARWSEIDIEKKVWTIPAGRMKAAREHRVPLSDRALAIVSFPAQSRKALRNP